MKTIKVTSNKQKRTFTIRTESMKYRTEQFSRIEFSDMEYNTDSDWVDFLKTGNYYTIYQL